MRSRGEWLPAPAPPLFLLPLLLPSLRHLPKPLGPGIDLHKPYARRPLTRGVADLQTRPSTGPPEMASFEGFWGLFFAMSNKNRLDSGRSGSPSVTSTCSQSLPIPSLAFRLAAPLPSPTPRNPTRPLFHISTLSTLPTLSHRSPVAISFVRSHPRLCAS